MAAKYSFLIPNREELVDLPGLLTFLSRKVLEPPHRCILCDRSFATLASVRRHMVDKSHTRLGTESLSQHGNCDALRGELRQFYRCKTVAEHADMHKSNFSPSKACMDDDEDDDVGPHQADTSFDLMCITQALHPHVAGPCLNSHGELELPNGGSVQHRKQQRIRRRASRSMELVEKYHRSRVSVKELMRSRLVDASQRQTLMVQREATRMEWVGIAQNSKAAVLNAPRLGQAAQQKGFWFNGSCKLNSERGNGCCGQGKRHQNAAVHAQPRKGKGRLAKWS